jgi:hypothetical protein
MSNGIKNIVEHVLHPSSLVPILYHAFAAGGNEKSDFKGNRGYQQAGEIAEIADDVIVNDPE